MGSDWIKHDGKGPPNLPPETVVEVRLRGGYIFVGCSTDWHACWSHDAHPDSCDIISYRLVPDNG